MVKNATFSLLEDGWKWCKVTYVSCLQEHQMWLLSAVVALDSLNLSLAGLFHVIARIHAHAKIALFPMKCIIRAWEARGAGRVLSRF